MRLKMLVVAFASALCAACAPKFIDVPAPTYKTIWVERDATVIHEAIATMEQREVVQTNATKDLALSASERVIWVAGVDVVNGKLQRTHERLGGAADEQTSPEHFASSALVSSYQFELHGDSLSASGQMALEKVKAAKTDRFYVEFLTKDQMSAENVEKTVDAWKSLSGMLKTRGLNTANVILGGGKYSQRTNAIVLVRVGK